MHLTMSHNLWGDKTITKLGNNVMKRHENVNITYAIIATFIRYEHTMRKHVLLGVGYNELRLRNESKVYQYGGNWFAAVSCVCIRDRLRIVGHLQRRMKMVDRQRYRQHSYFAGGSSTGDHSSSVSAQDVGGSQVIDGKDVISSAMSDD